MSRGVRYVVDVGCVVFGNGRLRTTYGASFEVCFDWVI